MSTILRAIVLAWLLLPLNVVGQDYDVLSQGVVKIVSRSPEGKLRTGTGFIVKIEEQAAYIVTAAHVVEGDKQPRIYFAARRNVPVTAQVLNNDPSNDVSLLLVRGRDNLPAGTLAIGLARDQIVKRGEQVATIGFPAGLGEWAVSTATIGSQRGSKLTLSGSIAEGNSGGPVLRGDNVVAMITSVEGIAGLAIPALILNYTLDGWGVVAEQRPATQVGATPTFPVTAPEFEAGQTFKNCDDCPAMVVVPAGRFTMGSRPAEAGRQQDEGPTHEVVIPRTFAVGKHEVTRGQFGRFVRATGRDMSGGCFVWDDTETKWKIDATKSWLDPGFAQTDEHPVVCVGWDDAKAYAKWLADKTGKAYRLLSEAEWEYAARAKSTTSRFWGDGEQQACEYANVADRQTKSKYPGFSTFDCDDRYAETAPVGKYKTNAFGLHDMLGNVWEWVEDCWNDTYAGVPTDGSAWLSGNCGKRVLRGGSWGGRPGDVRSAIRGRYTPSGRGNYGGVRLARTLP